jgi:hypothetical protein
MKSRSLTIPEIAMIGGTRVALGVGVGLILADKLDDSKRKGAGWALLAVGVLTTVPLVLKVLGKETEPAAMSRRSVGRASHPRLKLQT